MITVITRWESTQMSADVEYQMWRQLRGAFKIDRIIFTPVVETVFNAEQYENMMTCLLMCDAGADRAFLEPTGYKGMIDLPQGDIVLIVGNTAQHNLEHAKVNETYRIATPTGQNHAHLYGINAASIALAIRYGQ
jgi:hypothetical protein